MIQSLHHGWIITGMCLYFLRLTRLQASVSLRVPKYGQILEFINFTVLLLAFLLCLSSKRLCVLDLLLTRH